MSKTVMKTIFILSLAAGLALTGCSKKNESAETDSSTSKTTSSTPQMDHSSGMHATDSSTMGKSMDMQMMNAMMVESLGPADKNYEDRFIDLMIPHHEGAIAMAKDALAKASKPEIKKMAQDIISSQQKEIDQMKKWSQSWYTGHVHEEEDKNMMQMNAKMMQMLGTADKNYEERFINTMIPHHEGAIMMAKDAIGKTSKPELKKMAENIISSQQKEIDQMKEWRKAWYGH